MALSFREIMVAAFVSGLFMLALLNFASEFAVENGATSVVFDNTIVNATGLGQLLNSTRESGYAKLNATEQETPSTQAGQFTLFSVLQVARQYTSEFFTIVGILFGGAYNLGVPDVVLGVVIAVFTLTIIFLIWRLIRAGE